MAKSLKDLAKAINAIQRQVQSSGAMEQVAKETRDIIFKRTKAGRGVSVDESFNTILTKLKPLSKSYIKQRLKKGVTGEFGSARRSNLTNTGQMLNSMKAVGMRGGFKVVVPDTIRSDGKTNADIAKWVSENGRPFLDLAEPEKIIISSFLETNFRQIVRSLLR